MNCWIVTLHRDGTRGDLGFTSHDAAVRFIAAHPDDTLKIVPAVMHDPQGEVELDP